MKHLLLTTIAAVLLVGCGHSEADRASIDAAKDGNIEAVKQHLAAGADVNAKGKDGNTLLHYAIRGGYLEVVELLIATGADVNAKDEDGGTPLDLAILRNEKETADLLRKHGGKAKTPAISIHEAAKKGNIEAVKQHLAEGADVNAKDVNGTIPLHYAAVVDHKEIAELLIAKGADVNVKDPHGWTPLHVAAATGHKEIAELLITKNADVNAKNKKGKTPLDLAKVESWDSREVKAAKRQIADLLRQVPRKIDIS